MKINKNIKIIFSNKNFQKRLQQLQSPLSFCYLSCEILIFNVFFLFNISVMISKNTFSQFYPVLALVSKKGHL